MDAYVQENSNTKYTVPLKKIMKFKISHQVTTFVPEALPLATEPGSESEPQMPVSQEDLQGSGQWILLKKVIQ